MLENQGGLESQVISEVDLLQKLNVPKGTLDRLRLQQGFPYVRLTLKDRVYLIDDVLAWLKDHKRTIQE